jgi:transcriptional regulator with XRE-family HTH domain
MPDGTRTVGERLRWWRERRRVSQLELSLLAGVSARHLSFVETGRSRPSSEMILRIAEPLDVPLRERNGLLLAGGFAPAYPEHGLGSPTLSAVTAAMRQVLDGHEPYPALAVDRHWELVDSNAAASIFLEGAAADLVEPPVNVLRLALHPDGLGGRVINLGEFRGRMLTGLRRQAEATGDPVLGDLYEELRGYPCDQPVPEVRQPAGEIVMPMRIRHGAHELALISTTTVFGRPMDITVAELAIESFYPADEATAKALRGLG